jgi:hypothetical protein
MRPWLRGGAAWLGCRPVEPSIVIDIADPRRGAGARA